MAQRKPEPAGAAILIPGETDIHPGQSHVVWRPDGMLRWMLHVTVRGAGWVNGRREPLQEDEGMLLLFPPGEPHDYRADEALGWNHRWIYFEPAPSWLPLLRWPRASLGVLGLRLSDPAALQSVHNLTTGILDLGRSPEPLRHRLRRNLLEQLLLRCAMDQDHLGPGPAGNPRLEPALRHIRLHYAEPLQVNALARLCHLSPSRFAHLFRQKMGRPPQAYWEGVRLEHARAALIGSDAKIADIALECGFTDPLYFSRVFRKRCGLSPAVFRRAR